MTSGCFFRLGFCRSQALGRGQQVNVVARAAALVVMGAGAPDEVMILKPLQVGAHRPLVERGHLRERALAGEAVAVRVRVVGERDENKLCAGVLDALLVRPGSCEDAHAAPSLPGRRGVLPRPRCGCILSPSTFPAFAIPGDSRVSCPKVEPVTEAQVPQ
jgi:hypothetical protein